MLSFKEYPKSKPVASISGGRYNKKIIYITPPDFTRKRGRPKKEYELPYDVSVLIDDPIFMKIRKTNRENKLLKTIRKMKIKKKDRDEFEEYILKKKGENREIILHDGQMIPLPRIDARECIYVPAPSEAGKSTWMGNYAEQYKKLFPKSPIFVFSSVKEDPAIDKVKPIRIIMDEDMLDDPIEVEEMEDSLVIFDDANSLRNKKVKKEVMELQDALLETGRHKRAYVLISSHQTNKGKETKIIMNECPGIVVFPYSGNSHSIHYCLGNYYGLNRKQIEKILKLPSRWAYVNRIAPKFCMYQTGCYLLD